MPEALDLEVACQQLSQAIYGADVTPFTRDQYGGWRYNDIGMREGDLLAVMRAFRNEISDFVDPIPGETFEQAQKRPGQLPINHLTEFVRLVCVTYQESPTREFTYKGEVVGPESPQWKTAELIGKRYTHAEIDSALAQLEQDGFLTGNSVIVPWFDVDNDELVFHCYPSPAVRVVENVNNPKRPRAVVIRGMEVERGADLAARKVGIAQAWIPRGKSATFIAYRDGKPTETQDLQGPSPVVHYFEQQVRDSYYVPAPPGMALAAFSMIMINDHYSPTGYVVLMQNHSVLVVKGMSEKDKLSVGPGSAIRFPADSSGAEGGESRDAFFISPSASISEAMEFVDWAVRQFKRVNGIPDEPFDGGEASGRARQEAKAPLLELRKARSKRFVRVETELLRASLWQMKRANIPEFRSIVPEDWDVRVSWPEPKAGTEVEQIARDRADVELGVRSAADILAERKPDSFDTVDEAQEEVDRNIEELAKNLAVVRPAPAQNAVGEKPIDRNQKEGV